MDSLADLIIIISHHWLKVCLYSRKRANKNVYNLGVKFTHSRRAYLNIGMRDEGRDFFLLVLIEIDLNLVNLVSIRGKYWWHYYQLTGKFL